MYRMSMYKASHMDGWLKQVCKNHYIVNSNKRLISILRKQMNQWRGSFSYYNAHENEIKSINVSNKYI